MTTYYVMQNNKVVLYDKSKKKLRESLALMPEYAFLDIKSTPLDIVNFEFVEPVKTLQLSEAKAKAISLQQQVNNVDSSIEKPTKPSNLIPRSFGGVKNNFTDELISSGFKDKVPEIYGGDNLNYQLDAMGKEFEYCETIIDFINALPVAKTITTDTNNRLVYTDFSNIKFEYIKDINIEV